MSNPYQQTIKLISELPQCVPASDAAGLFPRHGVHQQSGEVYLNTLTGALVSLAVLKKETQPGEKTYEPSGILITTTSPIASGDYHRFSVVTLSTEKAAQKLYKAWRAQALLLGLEIETDTNQPYEEEPVKEKDVRL
jgi:hypothetical protein